MGGWLREPGVACLSLDVFATTLARYCERPVDVFPHVGHLLGERGLLAAAVTPAEFAELREEAERVAREARGERAGDFEVTLAEVYGRLAEAGAVVGDDPAAWAAAELEAEQRYCFANPLVLDLIREAEALGRRVVFVSDTYFSRRQLTDLLRHSRVPCEEDRVFVSSEHRAGKAGGKLFGHVLDALELAAERVVHVGDNHHADVLGARAAGIRPAHYYDANDYTGAVAAREAGPAGRRSGGAGSGSADDRAGRGALLALRTLAQRQCRRVGRDQSEFFRYGAFVLGPVLSAFAVWSARRFAAAGAGHVLALMREGLLLGDLLRDAAAALGLTLHVAPCYVSRQATALPMIFRLDERLLNGFWWRKEPPTLRGLAAGFGLDPPDVGHVGLPLDDPLDDPDARRRAIDAFLSAPLRPRAEHAASAARDRLVGYLDGLAPLTAGRRVGVLDLGWNGTIQQNLQRVLDLSGIDVPLVGCYLGLTGRYARLRLNGTNLAAFFGPAAESQGFLPPIVRSPEVLEQAVNGNVGSTLGYERQPGGVAPALGRFRCLPLEVRRRDAIKEGVRTYHGLALEALSRDPDLGGVLGRVTPRTYGLILNRLVDRPTQGEAFDLGGLYHDDNFGSDSWREICDGYADRILGERGPSALYSDPKVYWPQGTIARGGADLRDGERAEDESAETAGASSAAAGVRVECSWSEDGTVPAIADQSTIVRAGPTAAELEFEVPATAKWLCLRPGDGTAMIHIPEWVLETAGGGLGAGGRSAIDLVAGVRHTERLVRLDEDGRRWAAYHDGPAFHVQLPGALAAGRRPKAPSLMRLRIAVVPLPRSPAGRAAF